MPDLVIVALDESRIRFAFRMARDIYDQSRNIRDTEIFEIRNNNYRDIQTDCISSLDQYNDITVMFFAHGNENEIKGYDNSLLIKYPDNYSILNNLKIFSMSCSSAKTLGVRCIEDNYARVFFGFNQEISWDGCNESVFKSYLRNICTNVLVESIRNSYTFKDLKNNLEIALTKNVNKQLFPHFKLSPLEFNNIQRMIKAICLIGNELESV